MKLQLIDDVYVGIGIIIYQFQLLYIQVLGMKKKVDHYEIDYNSKINVNETKQIYTCKDSRHPGIKRIAKVIPVQETNREKVKKQVVNMTKLVKSIQSPGIVHLYDCIMTKHNIYIIEEYCEGGNLRNWMKKFPNGLAVEEARAVMAHILKSFLTIAKNKIVHGSLNLENVLIQNRIYKISHFEDAKKILQNEEESMIEREKNAQNIQILKEPMIQTGKRSRRSSSHINGQNLDVWYLGVIFYQLLYGKISFPDNISHPDTIQWFKHNKVEFPEKQCDEDIFRQVKHFIEKCIHPNELFRYKWEDLYRDNCFKVEIKKVIDQRFDEIMFNLKKCMHRDGIDLKQFFAKYSHRPYSKQDFILIITSVLSKQISIDELNCIIDKYGQINQQNQLQINFKDLQQFFDSFQINKENRQCSLRLVKSSETLQNHEILPKQHSKKDNNHKALKDIQNTQEGNIIAQMRLIICEKRINPFEIFYGQNQSQEKLINQNDFEQILKRLHINYTQQSLEKYFKVFDKKNVGSIDFQVFLTVLYL